MTKEEILEQWKIDFELPEGAQSIIYGSLTNPGKYSSNWYQDIFKFEGKCYSISYSQDYNEGIDRDSAEIDEVTSEVTRKTVWRKV